MGENNEFDYSALIQFLDEKFGDLRIRMERLESSFHDLQGSVDAYAKRADAYF